MPAGCSRIWPMMRASLTAWVRRSALSAISANSGRDYGEELAFIGDVERIEAQQFAGAAHCVAHWYLLFIQIHAASRNRALIRSGMLRLRRGGIAHPADARSRRARQSLNHREHGARVGAEFGFEIEIAASQQNGDAVIADRAGEQDFIAGPNGSRIDSAPLECGCPRPVVVMYMPSALPCSTTLVSPPAMRTPAAFGRLGHGANFGFQNSSGKARFEDERDHHRFGFGARNGEVIHRSVHGELADGAAGKASRE